MNSSPPFHPYGVAHLLVIFLTIVLPFALGALVRWTKSSVIERIIIGALSLTLVINYFVYLSLVRQFGAVSWEQLLPLQLCDWAMVVIIIAMWIRRPRWFEVAYFWGIGGTVQAVLTPNLAFGFPDFRFFSFFVSHCGIIIGIIFLMSVHHLATSLFHRSCLRLDGVLFHYHADGGQVHRVQLRLSPSQTGGENAPHHSLGLSSTLSFRDASARARIFCGSVFTLRHLRFGAWQDFL